MKLLGYIDKLNHLRDSLLFDDLRVHTKRPLYSITEKCVDWVKNFDFLRKNFAFLYTVQP